MSAPQSLLLIIALIAASAFFSLAEMSLAASRRIRLRQLAADGDPRAPRVVQMQEQPGDYFTVVQIAQNGVAIMGGIVGEGAFSPFITNLLSHWFAASTAQTLGFLCSFLLVTSLFILFADIVPKRMGMADPEKQAMRVYGLMQFFMTVLKPLVWLYSKSSDAIFRLLGMNALRDERITSDDILAMAEASTQAGGLAQSEQRVIANLFDLDSRLVTSAMTSRDRIAFFLQNDTDALIRARIAEEPYSTYPVCDRDIDHVIGYVDAKDLFQRALNNQAISLKTDDLIHKVLVIPDRLSLTETLDQFRQAQEDFAVVVNEYSLVVGVVTLNDVMSTVMGDLIGPDDEELIVQRDTNSWLIDGITPIEDVVHALTIDEFPHFEDYDTLAGFLMVMLRRIPRRTDSVNWGGYKFEVMDVDSYRIDQVLVTRIQPQGEDKTSSLSAPSAPTH
ncbi:HlyC/CorC family transporter [Lampropedia puyangensis]|uniref:Polyamine export protein n=1 Tax=Lampropedia puyangensis TaxID=1330072 RepID=A0A4S8F3Z0_9BURK|nr:hemolysin family protein [Lampropedia puyangensis]THU02073.1 HlyC/CorC family transporter [Lampropedia puyangensis]